MQPSGALMVNQSVKSVTIYCTYTAKPSQLITNQTKWFKDGELLPRDSEHFIQQNADYPMLTIANLSRSDFGSYICEVENEAGKGRPIQPVELSIIYAPTVAFRVLPGKVT